ncbi:MAG: late competence development ComFB family protein [Spirochaetota bacterium]
MRYIVNLLEDIVEKCTDEYLKDAGVSVDSSVKYDIIVYTLNKLLPQYVVSARGKLHSIKNNENVQHIADIYHCIHEGYEVVQKRRGYSTRETLPIIPEDGLYCVYPEVMGTVFNGKSFMRLSRGTVSMLENEDLIAPYNGNFPNPYSISEKTSGRYMFRFKPRRVYTEALVMAVLTLRIESHGFEPHISHVKLPISPVQCTRSEVPGFTTHIVNDIYLTD